MGQGSGAGVWHSHQVHHWTSRLQNCLPRHMGATDSLLPLQAGAWTHGRCKRAQVLLLFNIIQGGPKNRTCLSVDNSAMVASRKACDMSKVLECCRQKGPNLLNKSFKYSLPNLHKSSLPLKLGICLHSHVPDFTKLKNSLLNTISKHLAYYAPFH